MCLSPSRVIRISGLWFHYDSITRAYLYTTYSKWFRILSFDSIKQIIQISEIQTSRNHCVSNSVQEKNSTHHIYIVRFPAVLVLTSLYTDSNASCFSFLISLAWTPVCCRLRLCYLCNRWWYNITTLLTTLNYSFAKAIHTSYFHYQVPLRFCFETSL